MSIYIVTLNAPSELAWERLKDTWPKRHRIVTDHIAFVAPEDTSTTGEIGKAIGMNSEDKIMGVVAEINEGAVNGWNDVSVWEWVRNHQ